MCFKSHCPRFIERQLLTGRKNVPTMPTMITIILSDNFCTKLRFEEINEENSRESLTFCETWTNDVSLIMHI